MIDHLCRYNWAEHLHLAGAEWPLVGKARVPVCYGMFVYVCNNILIRILLQIKLTYRSTLVMTELCRPHKLVQQSLYQSISHMLLNSLLCMRVKVWSCSALTILLLPLIVRVSRQFDVLLLSEGRGGEKWKGCKRHRWCCAFRWVYCWSRESSEEVYNRIKFVYHITKKRNK